MLRRRQLGDPRCREPGRRRGFRPGSRHRYRLAEEETDEEITEKDLARMI
jgi:hypothetical protein